MASMFKSNKILAAVVVARILSFNSSNADGYRAQRLYAEIRHKEASEEY